MNNTEFESHWDSYADQIQTALKPFLPAAGMVSLTMRSLVQDVKTAIQKKLDSLHPGIDVETWICTEVTQEAHDLIAKPFLEKFANFIEHRVRWLLPAAQMVGLTMEDLVQEAKLAIWKKMDSLDPNKNIKSYIGDVASTNARDAIAKMGKSAKPCRKWKKINQASENLYHALGRKPTDEEMAAETGLRIKYIKDTLYLESVINVAPFGGKDEEENHSETHEFIFRKEDIKLTRKAIALCTENNQLILQLYLKLINKAKHEKIGIQIGRSKDQVRQTDLPKALEEFRKHYNDLINGRA